MKARPPLIPLTITLLGIGLLWPAISLASQRTTFDQPTIARQLLSDNAQERNLALDAATMIAPADRGQELRIALIALLEKQNRLVEQVDERGITLDTVEDPEFVASVHHAVAALKDPRAIPALARALGWFTTIRALTEFGEQAASAVLDVVTSPKSRYAAVDDGLRVLRFMVERRESSPLAPSTLVQIQRAARQRLTGEQYFTTLWYAIDLAMVLDDPELRRIVEDLATFPGDVMARGVIDPALIEQTRKRAADRLAGVPALPRP